MTQRITTSNTAVQGLDKPAFSGKKTPLATPRHRFRDAVPDYVTLITGRTGLPPEPFVSSCCRRWVERWSQTTLGDLRHEDLQSYFSELVDRGRTARDIEKEKTLLVSFYRWAQRCGWVASSPMIKLGRTRTPPAHASVAWTCTEQRRLLQVCRQSTSARKPRGARSAAVRTDAVPPYLYPLVLLGMRTGLRLGHLLHLQWRHVDLVAGRLTVHAHEVMNGFEIDVPLDGDCCQALEELLGRAQTRLVLPRRVFDLANLPLWKERPEERAVLQAFRQARKRAEIREGDFSSVRLTFVGNCARAGVPISYPLRVGDWADPEILKKVYQELGRKIQPSQKA